MGLDVTAYKTVKLLSTHSRDEWLEFYDVDLPTSQEYLFVDHPSRTQHDGMLEGLYEVGKEYTFSCGGYGAYNQWRNWLASLLNRSAVEIQKKPTPGPFVEIIHFSDCEGFMGPITCAKLAKDFVGYRAIARRMAQKDPYDGERNLQRYLDFLKAFRFVSPTGALKFS